MQALPRPLWQRPRQRQGLRELDLYLVNYDAGKKRKVFRFERFSRDFGDILAQENLGISVSFVMEIKVSATRVSGSLDAQAWSFSSLWTAAAPSSRSVACSNVAIAPALSLKGT
jgi:hypothetical protein